MVRQYRRHCALGERKKKGYDHLLEFTMHEAPDPTVRQALDRWLAS
jgi:hypothetical protein